jgi:uncharacterized protein (UPF0335 family)
MKVLDPGHRYELDNLEASTKTILQFSKDARLHGGEGADGPTCQEVLRAIIDRVKSLNDERPDAENEGIIFHARMMIAGFEARALRRRVEKEGLEIERLPLACDGHLALTCPPS